MQLYLYSTCSVRLASAPVDAGERAGLSECRTSMCGVLLGHDALPPPLAGPSDIKPARRGPLHWISPGTAVRTRSGFPSLTVQRRGSRLRTRLPM